MREYLLSIERKRETFSIWLVRFGATNGLEKQIVLT